MISRRRRVAIKFGTWRSGRSGGSSGSITLERSADARRRGASVSAVVRVPTVAFYVLDFMEALDINKPAPPWDIADFPRVLRWVYTRAARPTRAAQQAATARGVAASRARRATETFTAAKNNAAIAAERKKNEAAIEAEAAQKAKLLGQQSRQVKQAEEARDKLLGEVRPDFETRAPR